MHMQATVLRGVSGAGKSTWAAQQKANDPDIVIVSADYFMVDEEGNYQWNPARLGSCHNKCLRSYLNLLRRPQWQPENGGQWQYKNIIVDNTNSTLWETSVYVQTALALGYDVEVVTFLIDPQLAIKRSKHNPPAHAILRMDAQLRKSAIQMPAWWNQRFIWVSGGTNE